MGENRVNVWVQRFKDRPYPMLQWIDPETGKRKSKSAGTADEEAIEDARADLEYELTNGKYQEASRMTWERFRELFEAEYVAHCRLSTRLNYQVAMNLFEELCRPTKLRAINERTISAFAAAMRQRPARCRPGMMASTIKVRLQFLHTALAWAAEQKMVPAVPKFPVVKVPKKKPQPIPAESFERLYLKAEGDVQMQAFLLYGWLAGLRLAEAFNLAWEPTEEAPYLDLARDRIVLPAGMVKAVEDQWVPLDPILRNAIEKLPPNGKRVFHFVGPTGKPVVVNTLSDRVVALASKAGVRLTMHSLRKGFGCRYAGKVSAHVLQRLMRHAKITTTMDYYANVDEAVEEAVLGRRRNSLRNSGGKEPLSAEGVDSVTGLQLGGYVRESI
jgi:integrase